MDKAEWLRILHELLGIAGGHLYDKREFGAEPATRKEARGRWELALNRVNPIYEAFQRSAATDEAKAAVRDTWRTALRIWEHGEGRDTRQFADDAISKLDAVESYVRDYVMPVRPSAAEREAPRGGDHLVGDGGGAVAVAARPPRDLYLSSALKQGLKPDMFVPAGASTPALTDACTQYQFVIHAASMQGSSNEVAGAVLAYLKKNNPGGEPKKTGDVAPRLVLELPRVAVEELNARRRAAHDGDEEFVPQTIPSVKEILQNSVTFKSNPPPEHSIDGYRQPAIDNARLDVAKPQEVEMKRAAVQHANDQLAAANSFVRFEILGDSGDGFVRVRPIFSERQATESAKGEDHVTIQRLNAARQAEAAGEKFVSWADCHRTAQLIMGSEDQPGGVDDTERLVIGSGDRQRVLKPLPRGAVQYVRGAKDSGAARSLHGMLDGAVPDFVADKLAHIPQGQRTPSQQRICEELEIAETVRSLRRRYVANDARRKVIAETRLAKSLDEATGDRIDQVLSQQIGPAAATLLTYFDSSKTKLTKDGLAKLGPILDKMDDKVAEIENLLGIQAGAAAAQVVDIPLDMRATYMAICADAALKAEFCRGLGLNEFARPAVGDAMCQINDEQRKVQAEEEGRDIWNYHWAGVVMVNPDGSFMTLENLSVEDQRAVNEDWYFALYTPGGEQSFHAVNSKDSHVVEHATTMVMRNQKGAG